MRIFNEEKTIELTNPDIEHGYLRFDRLLIKHHEAIPEKVVKTVEEVKAGLILHGKEVNLRTYETEGGEVEQKYYVVTNVYYRDGERSGNDEEPVEPVVEPAVPAWDEYEDIQVYHSYTDEEYKDYLRAQRASICFPVVNRGAAWYVRLTPEQNEELQKWYQAWLDAPETGIKPETPAWI